MPIIVLFKIGNNTYKNNAIIAGVFPTPNNGIIKANTANVGIVCKTPAIVNDTFESFSFLDNKMPKGTATIIAITNATIDMYKCSNVFANNIPLCSEINFIMVSQLLWTRVQQSQNDYHCYPILTLPKYCHKQCLQG